jgi:hypothetical protein
MGALWRAFSGEKAEGLLEPEVKQASAAVRRKVAEAAKKATGTGKRR